MCTLLCSREVPFLVLDTEMKQVVQADRRHCSISRRSPTLCRCTSSCSEDICRQRWWLGFGCTSWTLKIGTTCTPTTSTCTLQLVSNSLVTFKPIVCIALQSWCFESYLQFNISCCTSAAYPLIFEPSFPLTHTHYTTEDSANHYESALAPQRREIQLFIQNASAFYCVSDRYLVQEMPLGQLESQALVSTTGVREKKSPTP